jgi:hypothetical protein
MPGPLPRHPDQLDVGGLRQRDGPRRAARSRPRAGGRRGLPGRVCPRPRARTRCSMTRSARLGDELLALGRADPEGAAWARAGSWSGWRSRCRRACSCALPARGGRCLLPLAPRDAGAAWPFGTLPSGADARAIVARAPPALAARPVSTHPRVRTGAPRSRTDTRVPSACSSAFPALQRAPSGTTVRLKAYSPDPRAARSLLAPVRIRRSMTTQQSQNVLEWRGHDLYDRDGDKIERSRRSISIRRPTSPSGRWSTPASSETSRRSSRSRARTCQTGRSACRSRRAT